MKFTKLLYFDVRNGICKNAGLILAPFTIALISFADFSRKFYPLALADPSASDAIPTYADHIMYIYGGMAQYIPNPAEPFQFPARWMVWFMSLLFFLSSYAYNDMQTLGIQILTRSGSRRVWWLSKTLWCFFGTLVFHAVLWLTVCIGCLATKAELSLTLHTDIICRLFQTFSTGTAIGEIQISLLALLLPAVVSFSLCLCQMTLSLFIKPTLSFLTMAVAAILSAYLFSPVLLCNYAMPIRTEWFMSNGVNVHTGYVYAASFVLFLIALGATIFDSYDMITR